jgi:CRISPR/Cas system Type II protein with McrA/HNH and RuvC-like nuclease domain
MEILILVLLYYLSQNPDFSESIRPLMAKLKNSEQMLGFLKDLSTFTQTFSTFQQEKKAEPSTQENSEKTEKEKPQSPTEGIADEFIQNILNSYLKQH